MSSSLCCEAEAFASDSQPRLEDKIHIGRFIQFDTTNVIINDGNCNTTMQW